MRNSLGTLIKLSLVGVATLALSATAFAADAVGKWSWTMTGRNGQEMTQTLTIKQDAGKLTGTISRGTRETAVQDLQVKGEELTFKTIRKAQDGSEVETKYSGKISGDTLKGKIETGDRSRDWEAKRVKEDKK